MKVLTLFTLLCSDILLLGTLFEGLVFEGVSDWCLYLLAAVAFLRVSFTHTSARTRVLFSGAIIAVTVTLWCLDRDDSLRLPLFGALGLIQILHSRVSPLSILRAWFLLLLSGIILFGMGVYLHEWWYCELAGSPCNAIGKTHIFSLIVLLCASVVSLRTRYGSWLEAFYSWAITLMALAAGASWVLGSRPKYDQEAILSVDSSVGYLGALILVAARILSASSGKAQDPRSRSLVSATCVSAFLITLSATTIVAASHLDRRIDEAGTKWFPVPEALSVPLLVSEDPTFFFHQGVDLVRIRDAIRETLLLGRFSRGGSTLPMQLAKVLYLSHEKTLLRKGVQIALALIIEQLYPKETLFLAYMNSVPLAPGVIGLPAGARLFFSRVPTELGEDENLDLVLTIFNPEEYSGAFTEMPPAVAARARTIRSRERVFGPKLKQQLKIDSATKGIKIESALVDSGPSHEHK